MDYVLSNVSKSIGIQLTDIQFFDTNYADDAALLMENKDKVLYDLSLWPSMDGTRSIKACTRHLLVENEDPEPWY